MEQLRVDEGVEAINKDRPRQSFVYGCVSYLFVFPIFRFLFRGQTIGISNLPKTGGVVVVSNHGSHLDPPIFGSCFG